MVKVVPVRHSKFLRPSNETKDVGGALLPLLPFSLTLNEKERVGERERGGVLNIRVTAVEHVCTHK